MRAGIVLTFFSVLLAASGCGSGSHAANSKPLVIAAFYPIAYAAERIDPGAEVDNLTPSGAEPHDLELTPRDVGHVRNADTVLYFGRGFMPALEQAVEGDNDAVDLLAGQKLLQGAEGDETAADPHVWLDPNRYARIVRKVARALGKPHAASGLLAQLKQLDGEYRTGLTHCRRHAIVTSHAAFGYLAASYGLEQVPLTGITPEAEPSAKEIESLVEKVRQQGATTVFFETLVSPKLAQTVAREAGAKTAVLDPIEGLTKDESSDGADYFSLMRANLAALRKALGCS